MPCTSSPLHHRRKRRRYLDQKKIASAGAASVRDMFGCLTLLLLSLSPISCQGYRDPPYVFLVF